MVIDPTTPLTVGGVAAALVGMAVGFIGHELVHYGVLTALGRRPSIEFGFHNLVFAAVPPEGTPRWQNALALVAPAGWGAVGVWALFSGSAPVLSLPLTLDGAFLLVGFAVGALPSPGDIFVLLLYRPEEAAQEVAVDG